MLEDLKPPVRKYNCKVAVIAATLDEKDSKILIDAVNNPEWQFKSLQNALADKGLLLVDTAIAKHRRKQCACFR